MSGRKRFRNMYKMIGLLSLLIVSLVTVGIGVYGYTNMLSVVLGILGVFILLIEVFLPRYVKTFIYFKYSILLSFLITYVYLAIAMGDIFIRFLSIILLILSFLAFLA